ncbi:MAG: threonine synthase [Elusimicrobiota bacterium]|nr:threonine synthase [Elusimicrobiota bacterium]
MSNFLSGFKCLSCGKECGKDYDGYICSVCGSNIDADYDYKAIEKVFSVKKLKKNKDKSVWRYKPLFPFGDLKFVPPLDMSITPLYRFDRLQEDSGIKEIYIKDDTRLPSGSFKDRASSVVMAVAAEKGINIVSAASTGNAGCSWACMGAAADIDVIIYVPKTAPRAKIAQLRVYGADVRIVDGNYDHVYDLCVKESQETNCFNRNTGFNPFTREGKKSVSYEIWEQLGFKAPGSVFVPVGDGNIISGVWKGFRDLKELGLIKRMPMLVAVQSANSDAVTRTIEKISDKDIAPSEIKMESISATTVADSISVDLPRDGVAAVRSVLETGGKAVRVDDNDIISNIKYVASSTGVFAEPAGVTSVAGLRKLAAGGGIKDIREPAVCLLTGNGLKDVDAVLKEKE